MVVEDQRNVAEHIEFERHFGLSAEEAISRVRTRAKAGLVTIDAEVKHSSRSEHEHSGLKSQTLQFRFQQTAERRAEDARR